MVCLVWTCLRLLQMHRLFKKKKKKLTVWYCFNLNDKREKICSHLDSVSVTTWNIQHCGVITVGWNTGEFISIIRKIINSVDCKLLPATENTYLVTGGWKGQSFCLCKEEKAFRGKWGQCLKDDVAFFFFILLVFLFMNFVFSRLENVAVEMGSLITNRSK